MVGFAFEHTSPWSTFCLLFVEQGDYVNLGINGASSTAPKETDGLANAFPRPELAAFQIVAEPLLNH